MELSVSPDQDARWCYLIVFLLGLVTAWRQVQRRVGNIPGAWSVPRAWVVFASLVPFPVALFWLLDRTSAINDTSIFAALIVGGAYDLVLSSGGLGGVDASDKLGGLWQTFSTWADKVKDVATARNEMSQGRFEDTILKRVLENSPKGTRPAGSRQNQEDLRDLAQSRTADLPALQTAIEAVETETEGMGPAVINERKARLLLDEVLGFEDPNFLLMSKGFINRSTYRWHAWDIRSKLIAAPIFVVLLAIPLTTLFQLEREENRLDFYVWRMVKQNTTLADQHRAHDHLVGFLRDKTHRAAAGHVLRKAMMRPEVPIQRVDSILGTILETRRAGGDTLQLTTDLVETLRTGSVDARSRIHDTLIFLAEERLPAGENIPEDLSTWSAAEHKSAKGVEQQIDRWKDLLKELGAGS